MPYHDLNTDMLLKNDLILITNIYLNKTASSKQINFICSDAMHFDEMIMPPIFLVKL